MALLLLPRLFASSAAIVSSVKRVRRELFLAFRLLIDLTVWLDSDPFLLFTMSNITDIKPVLTQKGLNMFCQKFHIPEDVHPQLPSPNQTIHEMPTKKISVYTRFFEYANFRLPLSTFLVNVLRRYHINLSQLSVIAAAKVSHFEILCRVHSIEPTIGLFLCFYVNSKNDYFSKRPDSDVVKVRERERAEGEAKFLDSTIGRVVAADQGGFAVGDGQDAKTELVTGVKIIVDENVAAEKPKCPRKKKPAVTDASGSSHPPKKLRGDYETSGGATTSGKSSSVLKELLASSMLNVEVGVATVATLPLVTSSVSATPEHESGTPTDSITRLNLCTIVASERFVTSSDSSHHSSTHASGAEGDSVIRSTVVPSLMTEAVVTSHAVNVSSVLVSKTDAKVTSPVHASMFHDSDSTKTVKADVLCLSYFAKHDLSMGSRELNVKTLHQVFVPQWNVLNDSLLHDYDVSREFVDHLAHLALLESECEKQANLLKARDDEVQNLKAQLLLKETESAEVASLRTQVFATEAMERIHADEIDALKQRNVAFENEKDYLDGKVHALETTCSSLRGQVSGYERLKEQIEEFQDAHMNIINDKVAKLDADLLEMALHLEENVAHSRVEKIRENVAAQRSALIDVWVPLVDPLSAKNLIGAASTSGSVPAAVVATTALSTTFISASSVPPVTTDNYDIVNVDGFRDLIWSFPLRSELASIFCMARFIVPVYEIAACSLLSSIRSKLISKALLFFIMSTSAVLKVGMPISTRITASVSYVSDNGVFPLLDLIIVRCYFYLLGELINCHYQELNFARTFRERSGYVDPLLVKWLWICDGGQVLLRIPLHGAVNLAAIAFPF
nr:hypothetical protein [Tanacetum cinerariifolium]